MTLPGESGRLHRSRIDPPRGGRRGSLGWASTAPWRSGFLTGQGICRTFCYNFLTSWFPTFLERAHGVRLASVRG